MLEAVGPGVGSLHDMAVCAKYIKRELRAVGIEGARDHVCRGQGTGIRGTLWDRLGPGDCFLESWAMSCGLSRAWNTVGPPRLWKE